MKLANKISILSRRSAPRANSLFINNYLAKRGFAALPENANVLNLGDVSPSDVSESSVRGVGALLSKMAEKGAAVNHEEELCHEIDEYFRKNFRKISFEDAKRVVLGLGNSQSITRQKIDGLDEKFWVWETLEEATRPSMDQLKKDEINQFFTAWQLNLKGSDELHQIGDQQVMYHFAQGPPTF